MCLILHRPVGQTFNSDLFVPAITNNPHGFGLMFPLEGRVKAVKGMFDLKTIYDIWKKVEGFEVAAHFRFTTLGAKNQENCHPFQVLNHEQHGRDLYMMHNGTMSNVPRRLEDMSDTWHFIEDYLRPVLATKPELIHNTEFQQFLSDIAGSSKLLFMGGEGLVTIVNEKMGSQRDGCWISNTYSIREKHKPHGNNASTIQESNATQTYQTGSQIYPDVDSDHTHLSKKERRRLKREQERQIHGGRDRRERQDDLNAAFAQMDDDGAPSRGSHSLTDAEFQAREMGEMQGFSDVEGWPV